MLDRYRDVFRSSERREVKCLVIGGVAAIVHGVPRATFDLDILIEANRENARRLLQAFHDAGMESAGLTTAEVVSAQEVTIFEDRIFAEVQTLTPGLSFEDAWTRRNVVEYRGLKLNVVSREDLLRSKRAAGRPVDLDDVRALEAGKAEA